MRRILRASCQSLTWTLLLLASCGAEPKPARTVVLISMDSVRADALNFRDAHATPNLERLARDGTVFTNALSGSSWTLPAHAQMFTGQDPILHGVQSDLIRIEPKTPTLPELLAGAGWLTAGWWTGWYLAGEYGFSRGFAVYENTMSLGGDLEAGFAAAMASGQLDLATRTLNARDVLSHQDVTSARVADRADAFLSHTAADEPLFLFLHLFDPHYDYIPPEPFDTRFDPDYTGSFDPRNFFSNKLVFDPTKRPRRQLSERDLEHVRALYRGEIAWTDAAIGRVLDRLDELGRLENALIIVTSDHGEEFFEHGGRGHRNSLYDEQLRVPLLVRPPLDHPSVGAVASMVQLSDLMPTILDFTGIEIPSSVQGRSLIPALSGEPFSSRPSLAALAPAESPGSRLKDYLFLDCVRTDEAKLIRHLRLNAAGDQFELAAVEYYDLMEDPRELKPILDQQDSSVVELQSELERLLADRRQTWNALEQSPLADRMTAVRELFQADLADLGYLGDSDEGSTEGSASQPAYHRLPWGLGPHGDPAALPNSK